MTRLEQATRYLNFAFDQATDRMKAFEAELIKANVEENVNAHMSLFDSIDRQFEDAATIDLVGRLLGKHLNQPRKQELTLKDMIDYCEDALERDASYRICNSTSPSANMMKTARITVTASLKRELKSLYNAEQKEAA